MRPASCRIRPSVRQAALAFGNLRVGAAAVNRTVNVAKTLVTNAAYQDSLDVTGAVTAAGLSVTPSFNLLANTAGVVTVSSPNTFAGSLNDTLALGLVVAVGLSGLSAIIGRRAR